MNLQVWIIACIILYFGIGFIIVGERECSMPKFPKSRIGKFLYGVMFPSFVLSMIFLNIVVVLFIILISPIILIAFLIYTLTNSKLFENISTRVKEKLSNGRFWKIVEWLTEEV